MNFDAALPRAGTQHYPPLIEVNYCAHVLAVDTLERLDQNPEYWDGKRGACVGVFQQVIARKERKEALREVVGMLKSTRNPQVEYLARVMKKWGRENGLNL